MRVWRSSGLFVPLRYLYGWCLGKAIAGNPEVKQMSGNRVPQSFQKGFCRLSAFFQSYIFPSEEGKCLKGCPSDIFVAASH